RIDRQVYFPDEESFADLPISLENFAGVWTGFLVIPEQGDYWLFWGADNGGRVELDGETVLLQDGMVRYVEVSTVLTLQPGLHPLRIEFAQAHNNVADWAKCAANFMWVPEGQTKPIPVPPEMLMVPEWMWSDNAPIITSLSQTEGEIGDEITIQGQGLYDDFDYGDGLKDAYPKVTFAGQPATVLEKASDRLKVRVPIGAQTGDVIVYKLKRGGGSPPLSSMDAGLMPGPTDIPSNSYGFKVTTQFGLLAQWYDLKGWSNFGPDVFDTGVLGDAAITRIEYPPDSLGVPTGLKTYAVKWAGRIGIPYTTYSYIGKVSMKPNHSGFVECTFGISGRSPFRVTLNGQVAIGQLDQAAEGYSCKLSLEVAQGSYLGCEIEMAAATEGAADLQFEWTRTIGWIALEGGDTPVLRKSEILPQMYFPPVVPPKPPEILNVKAVWAEGEQPPAQPYDADPLRPSVRVGQEFTFDITDYGPAEIWDAQPTVTIDGIPLAYTVDGDPVFVEQSERTLHCRSTMPDGVGEGKLVARISIVSSEPFLIDVINRGLVAYLYDIPEAFGLNELPDLQPLSCFKVRKDRTINFEDTADFDLPFPAETFVIEWLGGLIIEQEGDYEFICRSDDGMKLWLDDNVVIDANHRQAPAENKATVHLVPGVYRFRMQFFENNQHEVCVLEWRATQGEGEQQEEIIPRQVVPAKAFSLDTHPPFPDKTSTGKRTDGS
ncbi:MAG: IPT/TIG domain-containing protein, partial [Planctomycetes bacterium]|nr:IPT/TIG domain-containing protein [Planctomycetota bacterium]